MQILHDVLIGTGYVAGIFILALFALGALGAFFALWKKK